MLNKTGIHKTTYAGPTQILANVEMQYAVGCIVDEDLGVEGIVKAGTPVYIDTLDTQEPVVAPVVADGEEIEAIEANAILLHDVDVAKGNANGTALLFGVVNLNRVDEDIATKLEAEGNMVGQIFLVRL